MGCAQSKVRHAGWYTTAALIISAIAAASCAQGRGGGSGQTESEIEQALTVDQLNGADDIWGADARFTLTYCISNNFGNDTTQVKNKQAVINALDLASRSWDAIVNVKFSYVPGEDANCTANNTNVLFNGGATSLYGVTPAVIMASQLPIH